MYLLSHGKSANKFSQPILNPLKFLTHLITWLTLAVQAWKINPNLFFNTNLFLDTLFNTFFTVLEKTDKQACCSTPLSKESKRHQKIWRSYKRPWQVWWPIDSQTNEQCLLTASASFSGNMQRWRHCMTLQNVKNHAAEDGRTIATLKLIDFPNPDQFYFDLNL